MFIPPAGSPLSAYTPPKLGAVPPPPGIVADLFDPATGDIADLEEGADPTDAALQWQFTIDRGSGVALGDNGHALRSIKKATDDAPVRLADEAKRVVKKFELRGDLTDVTVSAEVIGDSTATGAVVVACKNVHTDQAARARGEG